MTSDQPHHERWRMPAAACRRSGARITNPRGSWGMPFDAGYAFFHRFPDRSLDAADKQDHRLIGPAYLLRSRPGQTSGSSRHYSRLSRRTAASSPSRWRHPYPLALIAVSRSRNPVLRWQTQDQHTARRYGTRSSVWSASLLAIKGNGIAKANRKAAIRAFCRPPGDRLVESDCSSRKGGGPLEVAGRLGIGRTSVHRVLGEQSEGDGKEAG